MFDLVPLRWERGYLTCWRGELKDAARTEGAKRPKIERAKPEIERGRKSGEGAQ